MSTPVRETTTLTNGVEMPMVGFGVHQNLSEQTTDAVAAALATGYRLVDTAAACGNEDHRDRADSADPTLSAEHTASRDAADPIEPTDSTNPHGTDRQHRSLGCDRQGEILRPPGPGRPVGLPEGLIPPLTVGAQ